MKNAIIKLAVLLAIAVLPVAALANDNRLKGSGNVITTSKEIGGYDKISASRCCNVKVVERSNKMVIIEADDNVMPLVEVYVAVDGTLVLTIDSKITNISDIHFNVTVPFNTKLSGLSATSMSKIDVLPTIKGKELDVSTSSGGRINFEKADVEECQINTTSASSVKGSVKCNSCDIGSSSASAVNLTLMAIDCDVDATSGAKVTLVGEAGNADYDASSAADINAAELNARKADADASSAADIKLSATSAVVDASSGAGIKVTANNIVAEASSGANVRYKGNMDSARSSSGGRIKAM